MAEETQKLKDCMQKLCDEKQDLAVAVKDKEAKIIELKNTVRQVTDQFHHNHGGITSSLR